MRSPEAATSSSPDLSSMGLLEGQGLLEEHLTGSQETWLLLSSAAD